MNAKTRKSHIADLAKARTAITLLLIAARTSGDAELCEACHRALNGCPVATAECLRIATRAA